MLFIGDFNDMSATRRQQAADMIWGKVEPMLRESGPMPVAAMMYLLYRRHQIQIVNESMIRLIDSFAESGKLIERSFVDKNTYYALPDQTVTPTQFPTMKNGHQHAYYDLLFRYHAIRANPELATMSDEYIDSLYNPQAPDTGKVTLFPKQ